MRNRKTIKTTPKQIVNYWKEHLSDHMIGVEWEDAQEYSGDVPVNADCNAAISFRIPWEGKTSRPIWCCCVKLAIAKARMSMIQRLCGIGSAHTVFHFMIHFGSFRG